MPRRRGRIVQPAQCDEARQELGVQHLVRRDPAVLSGERIGTGGIAVTQQATRQQVALGPERRDVIHRRVALCGLAGAPPQGKRVRGAVRSAQPAGAIQHHAGIAPQRFGQAGEQCVRVRGVALQGQLRLGRGAARRIQARDLSRRRGRIAPDQALEALPVVVRPHRSRPAAQEAGLVADARDPGAARLLRRLRVASGVRQRLGAVQHRLRQGQGIALALRQRGREVRVGGDGLLPPALQQRLVRPVRALRHEVGDVIRRRGSGREQPEIGDQFGCHRIGVGGGRALRIRPSVRADRRDRIGLLRQRGPRGEQREQSETRANRGGHAVLLAQADLAMHLPRA